MRVTIACALGGLIAWGTVAPPPSVHKINGLRVRLEAAERQKESAGRRQAVSFRLSEQEVNEYFAWSLREEPQPGLDDLKLRFFPNNHVAALALVDFDEVARTRPELIPSLLRYVLEGKKSVSVDLRFEAAGGRITSYTVEKASFDGVRLPTFLVEKSLDLLARDPADDSGPLELPYGLRRIWTDTRSLAGEN